MTSQRSESDAEHPASSSSKLQRDASAERPAPPSAATARWSGGPGSVNAVALGQVQGRPMLASAGADGTVRLWDPTNGNALSAPLTGHREPATAAAFGQVDGRALLASAGADGTVRLWDPTAGTPLGEPLTGHNGPVRGVAFGQVGGRTVLASAGDDRTVRLWNPTTGTPLNALLTGHEGTVRGVAFGEVEGRVALASAGADGTVLLWNPFTSARMGGPLTGHEGTVRAVAFGEVGERTLLASAGDDGSVRLWDPATGNALWTSRSDHGGRTCAVTFGRVEGRTVVASAGDDGSVRLWDPAIGTRIREFVSGHGLVSSLALEDVEGTSTLASAGADGTVRLWDPNVGTPLVEPMTGHGKRVNALAFGEVGGRTLLASAGDDGAVQLWKPGNGSLVSTITIRDNGPVSAIAFGQVEGRTVLAGAGAGGTVRVWDPDTGVALFESRVGHVDWVFAVAFGQVDGNSVLASANDDGTVWLLDPVTGVPPRKPLVGDGSRVFTVAFGQVEGVTVLASAGIAGTIWLWDPSTGGPFAEPLVGHTSQVNALAFGQVEGRAVLASAGDDGTVRLWDPSTGTYLSAPLIGHGDWVNAVSFGQVEGRPLLASAGADGTVRLWDPTTGTPLGEPLTGNGSPVTAVAFAHVNGEQLLAWSELEGALSTRRMTATDLAVDAPTARAPVSAVVRDAIVSGDDEAAVDLLGRQVLASHLVGVLSQLTDTRSETHLVGKSVVVSVDGRWGAGKSVLARLVVERLEDPASHVDDAATTALLDPLVVPFDTWRESQLGPEWWSLAAALNRAVRAERAGGTRLIMTIVGAWQRLVRSQAVVAAILTTVALVLVTRLTVDEGTAEATSGALTLVTTIVTGVAALAALALTLGRALFWSSPAVGRLSLKAEDNPLQEICDIVTRLRRWSPRRGVRHRLAETLLALWLLIAAFHAGAAISAGEGFIKLTALAARGEHPSWWLPLTAGALATAIVALGLPPLTTLARADAQATGRRHAKVRHFGSQRWLRPLYVAAAFVSVFAVFRWLPMGSLYPWFPWSSLAMIVAGVVAYAVWLRRCAHLPRRPLLLVLDDIDRCHEAHAVRYLETVHTLLRQQAPVRWFPRWRQAAPLLVLVLGDGRWIRTAFTKEYETFRDLGDASRNLGADFIQKLFDHTVLVPELTAEQASHFVSVVTKSPQPEGRDGAVEAISHRGEQPNDDSAHDGVPLTQQGNGTAQRRWFLEEGQFRRRTDDDWQEHLQAQARRVELTAGEAATQRRTAHLVSNYRDLMPANPRLIRRVVNAWGMLEALKFHVGHQHDDDTVVRAAVFLVTFPSLVDVLIDAQSPPSGESLLGGESESNPDRAWLRPDVLRVLQRRDGLLVEPRAVGECYGRQYPWLPPFQTASATDEH